VFTTSLEGLYSFQGTIWFMIWYIFDKNLVAIELRTYWCDDFSGTLMLRSVNMEEVDQLCLFSICDDSNLSYIAISSSIKMHADLLHKHYIAQSKFAMIHYM
jgi:hypothetical protein